MDLYKRLAELERRGEEVALATVIRSRGSVPRRVGSKMLVFPDGHIEGSVGGGEMESRVIREALDALASGEARILHYRFSEPEKGDPGVCGGEMEVFVEAIRPARSVVIFGAGHVGRAVAHLARWLGFRVVVADDRQEYANPEAVPDADEYVHCALAELPDRINITRESHLVLTTRGVPVDVDGLPALLETPAKYIGVIGSRRRWETSAKILREKGVSEAQISRIVSPMGLELNAETPEEIAVSILAQIIMLERGGTGRSMAHEAGHRKGVQGA